MLTDLLILVLLARIEREPTYFASCEYINGKWRWFIGRREGGVVCTALSHTTLVSSLKRYMKRKGIATLSFRWDSDARVQHVAA